MTRPVSDLALQTSQHFYTHTILREAHQRTQLLKKIIIITKSGVTPYGKWDVTYNIVEEPMKYSCHCAFNLGMGEKHSHLPLQDELGQ